MAKRKKPSESAKRDYQARQKAVAASRKRQAAKRRDKSSRDG